VKVLLISIDLVMGARILVNVLKEKDFEAKNLQIVGARYSDPFSEDALRDIYEFSRGYDVVGLSFNSFYSVSAARLGRYLKSRGVKWLIAGGTHVTAMPEEVMSYADMAVIYEAELTLPRVLKNLDSPGSLRDIGGIVFKDADGQIVRTGNPQIELDLDNIPSQSISKEDITYYNVRNNNFEEPTVDTLFPHGHRNYYVLTSRGCPFKCTYCSSSFFAKLAEGSQKVRKRSVDNIISEMKIAKQAGFEALYIADDNFLSFTLKELENFLELYGSQIDLPFSAGGLNPNNMRAKDSSKKIEILLKCGLSDIRIGVQSGSDRTLKIFNRSYTAEEVPKLLKIFENRKTIWKEPNDKLRIAVDFICDSPWEDEQDKLDTLGLANNLLSTYGVFFNTLIYLPATDIYNLALKEGWIKDKEKDIYLRGIGGLEDNIYNRLLYLIAVLKERGGKMPDKMISHILDLHKKDPDLSETLIDFIMRTINGVEDHHGFNASHLTLHPYLKGFKTWEKTVGQKGKKVLFRSYHESYG